MSLLSTNLLRYKGMNLNGSMVTPHRILGSPFHKNCKSTTIFSFQNLDRISQDGNVTSSFREDLSKVSGTGSKGCRQFRPTITSNGLCYTFNGESLSKMWRSSEVMETFDQIFPYVTTEREYFGGSGAVQGKLEINSSPQFTN